MSDYTYPIELIKKAESRIRLQLDGNGIDSKNISLQIKRQGIGVFTAETRYEADIAITNSSEKGKKIKGQLIDSNKIQSEIQGCIANIKSKDTLDSTARENIKSLPLRGFGAENVKINLKNEKKTYTEHATCERCNGQCQSQCQTCNGRGQMQCQTCHSQGFIQCLMCNGRGQTQDDSGMKYCHQCQGKGRNFCTQCHGQKQIACSQCGAKGTTQCQNCNGDGVNSTHITVEPFLKISSAINIQELDDEPKIYASKAGAMNLIKGKHVDYEEIKPPESEDIERAYYEDEPEDHTKNTVYYQVKMPWAATEIQLNDKPYKIAFVGQKGAVVDSGHFMDDLLKPQLEMLSNAARGNGFVAGLIKDACETRVSRETLMLVATKSRKKAMVTIFKKYNIGFTKPTIQSMVQNSYLALKQITKRPRYIGLAVGLTISTLIYYYWFINDGRAYSNQYPINIRYAMDSIPLIIGIFITLILTKITAFFTFKSVMNDIGINTYKMPALGKAGLYGLIGNLILWVGVLGFFIIK